MIQDLQAIGVGIITLALVVGVGVVVLSKFGDTTASCPAAYPYDASLRQCSNGTYSYSPTNVEWTSNNYLITQLGSGGLSGWVPAIIAMVIGLAFLGGFLFRKGNVGRY